MKHRVATRFWNAYESLPEPVQALADACFALLKRDSRHPSLHFKKVGRFWSARVGRIIAHSRCSRTTTSSGSGSAVMMSTTA